MLKLPKNILSHPKILRIEEMLTSNLRQLHSEGRMKVPSWAFTDGVRQGLKKAYDSKNLVQGLEAISDHLDQELKGLKSLKKQPGQTQNDRLSRLIILSNDGSERFYHNAESILSRHAGRAMACVVQASSEELGAAFTKKSNPAKAFLIAERKALEDFLAAMAESL